MRLFKHFFVKTLSIAGIICIALILSTGCGSNKTTRITYKPDNGQIKEYYSVLSEKFLNGDINTVKLHDKYGNVFIFEALVLDSYKNEIKGRGVKLDFNRSVSDKGILKVPVSDILLIETNENSNTFNMSYLTVLTMGTIILGAYCIANPKACFGSCPTFYASDGTNMILQAEGFSSSISPSLEAGDIDALYNALPVNRIFQVDVTNEAMETHIIRKANILAVPKPQSGRVFHSNRNEFFGLSFLSTPVSVNDPIGETQNLFSKYDNKERFSPADSNDLTSKESIELTFNNTEPGEKGLVLAFRQTLMTTFLFYQTLAFMGTKYGDWFSAIERGKNKNFISNADNLFGGIDAYYKNDNGNWIYLEKFFENGPIASDLHLAKIPELINKRKIEIKLIMTKGYWRIDYAAIGNLTNKIIPVVIKPTDILKNGKSDSNARACLIDSIAPLVTLPGDRYQLIYNLPENYKNCELFLDSRGYYIEWMRREWIAEENPMKINDLIFNPGKYFRDLSPVYKNIESTMENTFWSSRYVKK